MGFIYASKMGLRMGRILGHWKGKGMSTLPLPLSPSLRSIRALNLPFLQFPKDEEENRMGNERLLELASERHSLASLSPHKLCAMVHLLCSSPHSHLSLVHHLDEACSTQLSRCHQPPSSFLSLETRAQYWKLAYHWLVLIDIWKKKTGPQPSTFLSTLVRHFLEEEKYLGTLRPSELTFAIFIAGETRTTLQTCKSYQLKSLLIQRIERDVLAVSSPILEIGILSHGLLRLKLDTLLQSPTITERLLRTLVNAATHESQLHLDRTSIANISKFLGSHKATHFSLRSEVLKSYAPLLHKLTPQCKIRLFKVFTSKCPDKNDPNISLFMESFILDMPKIRRLKDLEHLSQCLITLNIPKTQTQLYHHMAKRVETLPLIHPANGLNLIRITFNLARVEVFDHAILNNIFQVANKTLSQGNWDLKSIDSLCTIHAAWDLCNELSHAVRSKHSHRWDKHRSANLYKNVLRDVAALDVELELCGEETRYEGERLDPAFRELLLPTGMKADKGDTTRIRVNTQIFHDLSATLQHCHHGYLYPHSSSRDTVFCVNMTEIETAEHLENLDLPIPKSFSTDLHTILKRPPGIPYGLWVAVVLLKLNGCDNKGNLLGPTEYRVRTLNRLGYKVILVDPYHYNDAMKKRISKSYIYDLVKKNLNMQSYNTNLTQNKT